ncbi:hypothetical protein STCU_02718 [Strigomonas culicis]|uniref:Uncharacterized protein n=1 Tax=Strigomonas culicis TaxID=28005 RepID=S9UVC8_9TRYP|nr:hypothetical protein STCU_02718 [Strigomonas culicis]|eukprot:EPY32719.1 hypothetical protein STCU_02718 [Strigomonas culicis]
MRLFSRCNSQCVPAILAAFSHRRYSHALEREKNRKDLKPIEMSPIYPSENAVAPTESGACAESDDLQKSEEPLSEGLQNVLENTPYRVSWYDYDRVTPAKRFVYWAYRRLRELPPEWQEYYRRMLYQEVSASRYVNQTWDCFMMVVDGYRKSKWVAKKIWCRS